MAFGGAILILLGAWVAARGLRTATQVEGPWGWKPLFMIALSIVLFGFLLDRAGMIPALSDNASAWPIGTPFLSVTNPWLARST